MRASTSYVCSTNRSYQIPRPASQVTQTSSLVRDFTTMRDTLEQVEQYNRQMFQSIKATQTSRARSHKSTSRQGRCAKTSQEIKQVLSLQMEIQRLQIRIKQERKSKSLVQQQLNLVQARCQRQQAKLQTIQHQNSFKIANLMELLEKGLKQFTEILVKDTLSRMQKINSRNRQLIENLYSRFRDRSQEVARQIRRRSAEKTFKKKRVEDNGTKQIETIGSKYQELLADKNEQLCALQNHHQARQKQIMELKFQVEQLRFKQRTEYKRANKAQVELLEITQQLKIQSEIKIGANSNVQIDSNNQISKLNLQLKKQTADISGLKQKVSGYQKVLVERGNTIEVLQVELSTQKQKKLILMQEYQVIVDKSKAQHRQRLQQLIEENQELKSSVVRRDNQQVCLQQRENQLLSRVSELQVENQCLIQRLQLQEDLYLKPVQLEESIIKSRKNSHEEQQSHEQQAIGLRNQKRLWLLQNEYLKQSVLQSSQTQRRLQQVSNGLEDKVKSTVQANRSLNNQILLLQKQLAGATREEILLDTCSQTNNEVLQIDVEILRSRNSQLEKVNVCFSSEVLALQHDLKHSRQVEALTSQKLSSLRQLLQDYECKLTIMDEQAASMNRLITLQKQEIAQSQYTYLMTTDNLKAQVMEKDEELQKTKDRLAGQLENKLQLNSQTLLVSQLRNKNLSEDLQILRSQLSTQVARYETQIGMTKAQLEFLSVKNIQNQQTIKFQCNKLNDIESQECLYSSGGPTAKKTLHSAGKIKTLEQSVLQLEITKANLQRQLEQAQKVRKHIREENDSLKAQMQASRQQYTAMLLNNEEKLTEKDDLIQTLEQQLRDRSRHLQVPSVRKNTDKSGISNSFMSSGQNDFSMDDNFNFLEKMPLVKLNLKRSDHIKLMEKVTEHMSNLKSKIQQKDKTIRLLNKRISAFRLGDFDTKFTIEDVQCQQIQRHIYMIQVSSLKEEGPNRRYTHKIKVLEDQKELISEENNILQREVASLQEIVLQADEDEKNFVRMKQIYKEEIGKQRRLIEEKNQKLKAITSRSDSLLPDKELKEAGSVFIKIMNVILTSPRSSFAKKQELQEFLKVITCVLQIDTTTVDWLVQEARR